MFYSQPLSTRFGTRLIDLLRSNTWTSLDVAVAWVRASGVAHLSPALEAFLKAGNSVRITVGVDLENTTKEGLSSLLALGEHGSISIFVHHNESGSVFHPKLYLFQNAANAKLIVGSNNITESGLYLNTEAGLEIDALPKDPIILSAQNALDSWRDTTRGLAKVLDSRFLDDLVANGYVPEEATLRAQVASRRVTKEKSASGGKKLFSAVTVTAPSRPATASTTGTTKPATKSPAKSIPKAVGPNNTSSAKGVSASLAAGQVLLMRVRTARGTQVQIPLTVMRESFFSGVTQVRSTASNTIRGIHETHPERAAGKNPNTLKLEMPETKGLVEPVARFERTATGEIQYEVYDASTSQGKSIMQSLMNGRKSSPPTTHLTLPSDPTRSTWWRFI